MELMEMIITGFITILFAIFMILNIIGLIKDNKKSKNINGVEFKIDADTYNTAILHLEKLIKFESIFEVNAGMGDSLAYSIGATTELSNEQINEINLKVQRRVVECLSPNMRAYFIDNFGEKWLLDYVKIYTLSMILGYSELSMTSLLYPN